MFFYSEAPFRIDQWTLQYEQNFEIMPSDFSYTYSNNTTANQALVQHSTLSSPLLQAGDNCFKMQVNNSAAEANIEQANLIGIQQTKAISIRSWVRIDSLGADTETLIGIAAKKQYNINANGAFLGTGYTLRIETGWKGNNFTLGYGGNRSTVVSTSSPFNKWIRLRLDVIPDETAGDKIIGYYTEQEDENWQLIAETIISKDDYQYIPWDNNRYQGLYVRDGQSSGVWYNNYFDKLQVYTANVR